MMVCCFPMMAVSIPEGFNAIVTKFGAVVEGTGEGGTFPAGIHKFPPFYSVDKLVPKQCFIFNTPVKDVKTSDNVTVNIDVMMVFRIEKARDFVYQIGPAKFDDLLRAMQDEALRQIAIETPIDKIRDLHGAKTSHIVEDLNQKVEKYGVRILHFIIEQVSIPQVMADDFEEKTLYDPKTQLKQTNQEKDRLTLNNQEGQQKLRDECHNMQLAAEQTATVVKAQPVRETQSVLAKAKKDIAEIVAQNAAEEKQVRVNAELEVSKITAEIMKLGQTNKPKIDVETGKLQAEAESYCKERLAESRIICARKLAEAKKKMGVAEGESSEAFAAARAFEADMKRLDILEQILKNKDVTIKTSNDLIVGLNPNNLVVAQVAMDAIEALRTKLQGMI